MGTLGRPGGATEGGEDGGYRDCRSLWRVDDESVPQAGAARLAGTCEPKLSDDCPETAPAYCGRGHRGASHLSHLSQRQFQGRHPESFALSLSEDLP